MAHTGPCSSFRGPADWSTPLELPSEVVRRDWSHRGWAHAVKRVANHCEARDEPLPSHAWLIDVLQLRGHATPVLSHMDDVIRTWDTKLQRAGLSTTRSASVLLMKQGVLAAEVRATTGVVHSSAARAGYDKAGERPTLRTVCASSHRKIWVAGGDINPGRYLSGRDVGALLGLTVTHTWKAAVRVMTPSQLFKAAGDSTAMVFAVAVWRAALLRCSFSPEDAHDCGSLYSGCFDTFLSAGRICGVPLQAAYAAESEDDRQEVLRAGGGYRTVYCDSLEAARAHRTQLLALFWTPECGPFSVKGNLGPAPRRIKRRKAVLAMKHNTHSLLVAVRSSMPIMILGEQVSGLLTHYKSAFSVLKEAMRSVPYAWFMAKVEAAQLGCPTYRERLGIIAVRIDRLKMQVPRSAMGTCHCSACDSEAAQGIPCAFVALATLCPLPTPR